MSASNVNKQSGLAFSREARCVEALGDVEGFACVSEIDGDRDGVELHVGRSELGVEVVAVLT
jgi:hypothetical protein